MKQRFSLFAIAVILLLTVGCSSLHPHNVAQPVTDGFSCQAAIRYRELELVAQLSRRTDGMLLTTFSLPKSLSGITLGWDGTDMTMSLGGITLDLPTDKVPESALIRCILQVLSAEHEEGMQTEEGYVITGEVDGKAYTLVCDPDSGYPRSLSMPQEELSATFTQMKALSE